MSSDDLFAVIAKHGLTLTPTGTLAGSWVAFNNSVAGRGQTPEDAVREASKQIPDGRR